jgi:hypothetical protein
MGNESVGVEQRERVEPCMDRENFALEQIGFQEFLFHKRKIGAPWGVEEFDNVFGRIVSPIRMDAGRLLMEFGKVPHARKRNGISVFVGRSRWRYFNSNEIDEYAAGEIIRIAEMAEGYFALNFSTRSSDRRMTNKMGFKLTGQDDEAVSVYCCVPGHLRGDDFVWLGEEKEFTHAYGILTED